MTRRALVDSLRSLMKKHGVDAYLIGSSDPHNSEYIPAYFARREYITNFTGSFGTALVTESDCVLWTDSRYMEQAKKQLGSWWSVKQYPIEESIESYLATKLPTNGVVGFDGWCMPFSTIENIKKHFQKKAKRKNITMKDVTVNLIDSVWDNDSESPRTPLTKNRIFHLPIEFSGKSARTKIDELAKQLKEKNLNRFLLTTLDDIAWVLNLRGSDVSYNPVFISYCVVSDEGQCWLFIDSAQVSSEVGEYLKGEGITVRGYDDLEGFIRGDKTSAYGVDVATCNYHLVGLMEEEDIELIESDPLVAYSKCRKNLTELSGAKACHVRDGSALSKFLFWLEQEITSGASLTEIQVSDKLESFRTGLEHFKGLSFSTISASGPNAALPHYRAETGDNRTLSTKEIYLVDSGAQYLDGTTDVTRTVHFGTPSPREIDANTRVLKGHLTLAKAIFPGTAVGNQLDTFARYALWQGGLDFGHGTGHGVGSYLCVHEGPQGIRPPRKTGVLSAVMAEGMIVSNEPGYYEAGNFGIRIENLVYVKKAEHLQGDFYTFGQLTMAPIQKKLINPALLTSEELATLNEYHATVLSHLLPLAGSDEGYIAWLKASCAPL